MQCHPSPLNDLWGWPGMWHVEGKETRGQVAATRSCFGTMVTTQSVQWAVHFGRLWTVDTEGKDTSSPGCVRALLLDQQEHTCNSAGWDRFLWQQRRAPTTGKHRATASDGTGPGVLSAATGELRGSLWTGHRQGTGHAMIGFLNCHLEGGGG